MKRIVWIDTGIRVFGKTVIGAVDEELFFKTLKREKFKKRPKKRLKGKKK